ncbi:MAG: TetR/AcrR family transcriptional regulator [Pirellulales bacterium]
MNDNVTDKSARELFGDGKAAVKTRDRLIDCAMDLFYVHGIHAVGLDRVIKDVGVTKTTFYNHFESKDELICEVLKSRHEWESASFMKSVNDISKGDPRETLLALFDVLHQWFTDTDFRGCQFINAAAEFPSPIDPVHIEAASFLIAKQQWICETAQAAGASDPESLGKKLMVIFEGAITLRQIAGDDNAASAGRELAEVLLRESIPEKV